MWRSALALLMMAGAAQAACPELPAGPPGGGTATALTGGIYAAAFTHATTRYPHGVLGDSVEGGGLSAVHDDAPCLSLVLPEEAVFEDLKPRLADLTGDGENEIVVVESDARAGAQLAVYGFDGAGLAKVAATPHIGRANRWLAPAGIADFDGDGQNDVAYVETPHLGKTLRLWTMRDGALVETAALRGVTNHRIGEDFITGGARDCGDGPEIVLADAFWTEVVAVRLEDGALKARALGPFSPQAVEAALACR